MIVRFCVIVILSGLSGCVYADDEQVPDQFKVAWKTINEGRVKIGKKPFTWNHKLHKSAQELANWSWDNVQKGIDIQSDPHHDFLGRLTRAGWNYNQSIHPPGGRTTIGNASEHGATASAGPNGFVYPAKTPEQHAKEFVWGLTESNIADNLTEPHVSDYRADWNFAAIGWKEGMFVVTYGYAG